MKKFTTAIISALSVLCIAAVPMTADAATPEEVAQAARAYGFPEDLVQQLLNICHEQPEKYTPDVLDDIMLNLEELRDAIVTNVPYVPPEPTVTTPAEQPDIPDGFIVLTMPDGSTFTRISREDFIAMSYDEKQAYIAAFTPEQQTVFLNDLSPEEYRSLMQQLPDDKKSDILDDMSDITAQFDITLNVDDISEDNLVYSLKNENGELIGVNSVKNTPDNTGYDRRGILAAAASLIAVGFGGLFIAVRKAFRKEKV